ncbi:MULTISPECIES: helix-turn-helix domain-containing protein [Bradyrhizobium]|jgi:AraC family transcriptional regulator|uniref:AraC family transcriptional regulator n=1 Tax=Bradyrhizobium canariense TaxID=255045 RepID=A0A1X3GZV3_9BRAD|nr:MULTISPECIES: AraC family transcriptional regulator [Bradyrhizobium]MCK1295735.1 helix-turn-helix transcriptional regulator [Bradyrhizobium sp. 30]OSI62086.1 AraC family transcriptional regulator [Bradyrhizobium canariense]OSI64832.1 AraC family transcriptional regulator [Bradyrhizobium canariense]OSI74269.1 AraC family transcriptional regulator [Bradyrhizobium canariense]OSI84629.1 AraC family transcriptional regulator [Bradyrhizobium canariense]
MTQAGVYGQRLGQGLRSKQAPVLITRSLHSAELAVTEVRNDDPTPDISGSLAAEDAYLLSLKLRDYPDCECWEEGRCVTKADVRAGATYLYDLKRDPRYVIDKPFHSLFFYLPRSALNSVARQPGGPRVGELSYEPGVGHDDEVVRHVGASLQHGLRRPDETNQLFVDHMMLALTAHVAQTYGGLKPAAEPSRGGLAPWQVKRACDRLDSDLSGKIALQLIATELGLSVSHFSRAFRISTGLPPHQWLLQQRVKAAKQLMTVRDLPLSEIAISAGFANQSHFTRVFSSIVGVSPGAWRRETDGGRDKT